MSKLRSSWVLTNSINWRRMDESHIQKPYYPILTLSLSLSLQRWTPVPKDVPLFEERRGHESMGEGHWLVCVTHEAV